MKEVSYIQTQPVGNHNHPVVPTNLTKELIDGGGLLDTILVVSFLIRALTDLIKTAKS